MRYSAPVVALCLALLSANALASGGGPVVSVGLFAGRRPAACTITGQAALQVETDGAAPTEAPAGKSLKLTAAGDRVKLQETGAAAKYTLSSAQPLRLRTDSATRSYRGAITVTSSGGRLTLVNVLPMEDYLRGVVPAEVPPRFAPEAIKAQAIAARTYALSRLGLHRDSGYDLCDGMHCQVYLGADAEDGRVDAAIASTAGLIVTYEGKPIDAVYHDSCGGMTASSEEVWGDRAIPYLRSVPDRIEDAPACARGPHATWTRQASQAAVASALSDFGVTAPLTAIIPQACEEGERAKGYKFVAADGREWIVCAAEVRALVNRALGANTLLSASFVAAVDGDKITFTGHGAGHGVGLCQWGANGLAAAGRSASEILAHYYTGVAVGPMSTEVAQGEGQAH